MREEERREVCKRLNLIEAELAAQLLESYSGRVPVEFWTAVERLKLFLEMKGTVRLRDSPGNAELCRR